eukprot:CAMPEP_0113650198 /NCGR_PEP_ID=MMETSP0017_2-20120614/26704_1 /TAXON_ID=2856 /ORGANISM="Cylindrotheca closterium" /LENGTH=260 /DNA_ID=CAMNT_0000562681 /DNA_START=52 /DNA_END=834 /DNA_ORIENTATION=+ /assembly_acc=CAM_ASM_000147
MAIQKKFLHVITVFSRLVTLVFASLAIWAFLETQVILKHSKSLDDLKYTDDYKKMMVPMILCLPEEFSIDGDTVSVNVGGEIQCESLDFLINSCAASLLFASVSSFVFIIIDWMSRHNKGHFNMSAAAGMGLFLFFILLMTGITTGALVEQNMHWVETHQIVLNNMGYSDITAEAYGNLAVITSASVFAFIAAMVTAVDATLIRCCAKNPAGKIVETAAPMPADETAPMPSKTVEPATTSETTVPFGNGPAASDRPAWLA